MMMRLTAALLVILLASPVAAQNALGPEANADAWRTFASKLDVGSRVRVQLAGGQRFSAILIEASVGELLLQPRTRVPVPIQHVTYDRIVSLERDREGGIGPGKALAIGVAGGVAAFFGAVLIAIAAFD